MGHVTTRTIMLHVILRYNERGDLLQGYGQVTWFEHTFIVPLTCHVTRMINKNTLKGNNKNKIKYYDGYCRTMLCIFSIVRIWSRVKVKCDGKQFRNIT